MILEDKKIWLELIDFPEDQRKYVISACDKSRRFGRTSWFKKRHPEKKTAILVDFDSIPEDSRTKLPPREELIAKAKAELTNESSLRQAQADISLTQLHRDFRMLDDYRWFLKKLEGKEDAMVKADELSQAQAWLRLLTNYQTKTQTRAINFETKALLRQAVLNQILEGAKVKDHLGNVKRLKFLHGFKVTNVVVLQRTELQWGKIYDEAFLRASHLPAAEAERQAREATCSWMLHGNEGNSHRLLFNEAHQHICLDLYSGPCKLDMTFTFQCYQKLVREELSEQPVEISTVKEFLSGDWGRSFAAPSRHGSYFNECYVKPLVLGKKPQYSFSLVAGDGWQPGRTVRVQVYNQKRQAYEWKEKVCTVWLWYDWMSEAIVGFDIAPNEDYAMIRSAFRQILTLNDNLVPKAIILDRKAAESKENELLFNRMGVQVMNKRAYNPKENPAERLNKEMNKVHRILDQHWVNITNHKPNYVHNPEHVRGAEAMQWNEYLSMIMNIINVHNNQPLEKFAGKSRAQVCQENVNPECERIDPLQRTLLFGVRRCPETIRNGVLSLQINSRVHEYEVPEWHIGSAGLIGKTNKRFQVAVYYDERFLDTVDIYRYADEQDGSQDVYLGTCTKLQRVNKAPTEQTHDDKLILGHQVKRQTQFNDEHAKQVAEHNGVIDTYSLRSNIQQVGQELYKDALGSEIAKQYRNVAEDKWRDEGVELVLVESAQDRKTNEQKLRDLNRRKYNMNPPRPNGET